MLMEKWLNLGCILEVKQCDCLVVMGKGNE